MVNDQGGVAGHKINFISYDDGYSPPKTVEQVRRLIEEDQVAFLFKNLGTPTNTAIQRYVNQKKVPHLFVSTGADKWGDYQHFPWTMGYQPSYRTEAQIYAKYMMAQKPDAKMADPVSERRLRKGLPGRREGRAGRQIRQHRRQGSQLRDDGRDGGQPTDGVAVGGRGRAAGGGDAEVRGSGDQEGARSGLAPDVLADECVDLGRGGDDSGGSREWGWHHHDRLHEGPDGPGVQGRSRA